MRIAAALCLMAMLAASAVYNLTRPSRYRRILRRIDEAAIFLMIAVAAVVNVIVAALIGTPGRFLIASFGAILLSEGVDTEIYHRLRQRSWLMRVFSSNAVSVPLDSITFTVVAFAGEPGYDAAMMLQIVEADLLFKFGIGALIALGKSWWDRTLKEIGRASCRERVSSPV